MPFTPFHFGPGAAIHAIAPKHVSFLSFCAANVIIDCETLYNIITKQYPLHQFLHTYLGATLIIILTTALIFIAQRISKIVLWIPNIFQWKDLGYKQIILGSTFGSYTHILLDSLMHRDMKPLIPLSETNIMLNLIPIERLHLLCIILGVMGLVTTISNKLQK